MGKRRFIHSSDDEADEDQLYVRSEAGRSAAMTDSADEKENANKKLRTEAQGCEAVMHEAGGEEKAAEGKHEEEEEDEGVPEEDAKPVGKVIKTSGKGRGKRLHYKAFEYDGNQFELEDPVLLTPEENGQKPYVAIIKDITQSSDGSLMVTGQWFYRPEEAERKGGGSWEAHDTRELFYSFHHDEVPAESVMHKCVVHFVPPNKQLPLRSKHPGFIVQKVYDTVEKKLWKLTDKDYEDHKQHEIDLLVQKTRDRLGELPDIEPEIGSSEQDRQALKKKHVPPIVVSKDEEKTDRSDLSLKVGTPGRSQGGSTFSTILANFKVLTRDMYRDKWLEKLLEAIHFVYNLREDTHADDREMNKPVQKDQNAGNKTGTTMPSPEILKDEGKVVWPEDAVWAVSALEQASHAALGCDFQKYNQKMRQMCFNLRKNWLLARRLLNKELEASVILNMSPNELKDALTAEEKLATEPEEAEDMQMTDVVCTRCSEKKVGVANIIQAGGSADRYLLVCTACGNSWYAFRDVISSLTVDVPNVVGNVGTAPWATKKFEAVEKKVLSPRDSDNVSADIFQKTQKHPKLETQKSLNRVKPENQSALETQKSLSRAKPENICVSEAQKSANRLKPEDENATTLNRVKPENKSALETQKSLNRMKPDNQRAPEAQKSLTKVKPEDPNILATQKSFNRGQP